MAARVVARYRYTDETRAVRYCVVRREDKSFHMEGDSSVRFPYRLPNLIGATEAGGEAFIVEGEKDVDRLTTELRDWRGYTATTSAGGASWQWPNEWADYFRGLQAAYVVADNDDVGRTAALQRARVVARAVPRVTLLAALPNVPEHGDASDWLDAGGNVDALYRLCYGAPEIAPLQHSAENYAMAPLTDYKPEAVEWLWAPWLPRGKLVILDGDPALGKSTMALDVAARITSGGAFPDGTVGSQTHRNVLILTAEDGIADTVKPRFMEAGGDDHYAWIVTSVTDRRTGQPRPLILPDDIPALGNMIRDTGAVFVVIDVLVAYLSGDVNSHNDASMRGVLMVLSKLAEETRATIVCLRHLNKSPGMAAIYRGGGSIGIIGAARAGWIVGTDPEDENKRVLAMTKCNLAAMPQSLSYSVVRGETYDVARIAWHGIAEANANALVEKHAAEARAPKVTDAAAWLVGVLTTAPGGLPRDSILTAGADAGYAQATIYRARKALGNIRTDTIRDGPTNTTIWYME